MQYSQTIVALVISFHYINIVITYVTTIVAYVTTHIYNWNDM
jgi:hypothetical protein